MSLLSYIAFNNPINHSPNPPIPQPQALDQQLLDTVLTTWTDDRNNAGVAFPDSNIPQVNTLTAQGASVHHSGALFLAARLGADARFLRNLVRCGGNVNQADASGNRPIHEAASCISPSIQHLVQLGANWDFKNAHGSTPFELLVQAALVKQGIVRNSDRAHRQTREEYLRCLKQAFELLCPRELKAKLYSGVMPQRMLFMLFVIAENASTAIDKAESSFFENWTPQPVEECLKHIPLLEYVKKEVLDHHGGLYRSFVRGWAQMFQAIALILQEGKIPTVKRVKQELEDMDVRMSEHFFAKGGKVECSLDAVISLAEIASFGGNCSFWDPDMYSKKLEKLRVTSVDKLFDVMRAMCFYEGKEDS